MKKENKKTTGKIVKLSRDERKAFNNLKKSFTDYVGLIAFSNYKSAKELEKDLTKHISVPHLKDTMFSTLKFSVCEFENNGTVYGNLMLKFTGHESFVLLDFRIDKAQTVDLE